MDDILSSARAVLETTPERWRNMADRLPADLLARPPAAGEWSALECLMHLVDTEHDVFSARVGYLLEGKDFPAFDPDSEGTPVSKDADPRALAETFGRLRQESLGWFDRLAPGDLDRTARHGELGPVTLGELLHEWAAHDLMHTVQAERAVMQPFIAGCGPWQPYFADHWASG